MEYYISGEEASGRRNGNRNKMTKYFLFNPHANIHTYTRTFILLGVIHKISSRG